MCFLSMWKLFNAWLLKIATNWIMANDNNSELLLQYKYGCNIDSNEENLIKAVIMLIILIKVVIMFLILMKVIYLYVITVIAY